ncbi:MAG: PfkB domain protein [Bacteroidetes bacterium]|nr:PfkB domain protein [Bacteroidota bacterium]
MSNKILGMGNALVDILTVLESDELLHQLKLPKGSMQLIDRDMMNRISGRTKEYSKNMVAGGSASNTLNAVARLGLPAGFVGKIGPDQIGEFYQADARTNGINPLLFTSENESGRCMVMISKDGERTMGTFLGASAELEARDITPALFEGYRIFHIEGYLVQNYDLIRTAINTAKAAGLTVSLDLASFNVVEANIDFLKEIIPDKVDIVFANEEEAKALTGKELQEALHELGNMCSVAVVKIGKDGSLIKHGDDVIRVQGFEANCVDTTGAGDIYAAGFLYGFANDLPLEMSGRIGSYLAARVVEEIGPKIQHERWSDINQWIEQLTHVE